jgi:voltage-gated potassium channel
MYWVMTTITTVGYGDFSPTNMLSRIFLVYVFIHGIIFFGTVTDRLLNIQVKMRKGMGFHRKDRGRHTVLMCGTGVG